MTASKEYVVLKTGVVMKITLQVPGSVNQIHIYLTRPPAREIIIIYVQHFVASIKIVKVLGGGGGVVGRSSLAV